MLRNMGVISPEQPPKGEHQSNGQVENAGKVIRDLLREFKLQLELSLNMDLNPNDAIIDWMARWAAMILSRYSQGKDGKMPYFRQTGNNCSTEVFPFAEEVWFNHTKGENNRNNSLDTK